MASARDSALSRLRAASDRFTKVPGAALMIRILGDIARGNVTDRAMTLAAQAFTSVLPIVILLTTLPGSEVIDRALSGLGINPEYLGSFDSPTSESAATAFGLFGALMVIAGATSLSRALGRMYVAIWRVSKLPLSGWWRWVVVIFLLPAAAALQGLLTYFRSFTVFGLTISGHGLAGLGMEVVMTFALWTLTWTVVPRILVSRQVPMRLMLVNGLVTGFFLTILLVGSRIVMPPVAADTTDQFGMLGLVFLAITWLFIFAGILVVTAIVVHAATVDDGPAGRWLRRHAGSPKPLASNHDHIFTEPV